MSFIAKRLLPEVAQAELDKAWEIGKKEGKRELFDTLERQLFRKEPIEDEVCHLTWDMWQALKVGLEE